MISKNRYIFFHHHDNKRATSNSMEFLQPIKKWLKWTPRVKLGGMTSASCWPIKGQFAFYFPDEKPFYTGVVVMKAHKGTHSESLVLDRPPCGVWAPLLRLLDKMLSWRISILTQLSNTSHSTICFLHKALDVPKPHPTLLHFWGSCV